MIRNLKFNKHKKNQQECVKFLLFGCFFSVSDWNPGFAVPERKRRDEAVAEGWKARPDCKEGHSLLKNNLAISLLSIYIEF